MPDFANMTEEEQIAFAMQMSMQDARMFNHLKKKTFNIHHSSFASYYRRTNYSTSKTSKER